MIKAIKNELYLRLLRRTTMDEAKKILRVFQLIVRLRASFGCAKKEVAEDFGVSERTIERYFNLLRDLGFEIRLHDGRHKIDSIEKRVLRHEEMIGFSLEEATAIRDALLACSPKGTIRKGLLDKLYALTELEELSEVVFKQGISKNISQLREAIKAKEQVVLKGYHSAGSGTVKDYTVEPIRLHQYYSYLMAYDINEKRVKQFKTERISTVETTGRSWKYATEHKVLGVDPFGMTGTEPVQVHLKLSKRAKLLLEEEHPDATGCISQHANTHYFKGNVYSLEGIGRFVLSLLDEITILEPPALTDYITKKIATFTHPTQVDGTGL